MYHCAGNATNKIDVFQAQLMGCKNTLAGRKVKASQYTILVDLADGKRALAYNTQTTAFAVLDEDEKRAYRALEADGPSDCSGALDTLWATGFLVPEGEDEVEHLKAEYWSQRDSESTISLTIAPTLGCNVACHYCFQGLVKPNGKMSEEVQDEIVRYVRHRARSSQSLDVCWYGGEPLMDQKAIFRLSKAFHEVCQIHGLNYSASMVSNGYLLNKSTAERLLEVGVGMVQITIDGTETAHDINRPLISGRGTYTRTIQNMKEVLAGTAFRIGVRCNVGIHNVDSMYALLDEMADEGFADFGNFSMYFAQIEATTDACADAGEVMLTKKDFNSRLQDLEARARAYGLSGMDSPPRFMGLCVAASTNGLVIGPEGQLHKCWETLHDEAKQIGTIFEINKLDDDIRKKRWAAWDPFDNPTCRSCKIAPMCSGFCALKFLYPETMEGDSALPCPPWKFSAAEKIFAMAESAGAVTPNDWDPEQATMKKMQAGPWQTHKSMELSRDIVNAIVMPGGA
ncbi:MAG: radical SAM protein [Flavimaricola sp.]|nr:radical SAM protein [Flavimaricola sp.]